MLTLCHDCWYAYVIAPLYVLAGLIRLGYYNITEEIRTQETDDVRKDYSGLPITSAALIFPIFFCGMAVYCICAKGEILPYKEMFAGGSIFGVILAALTALTGLCFILPFKIRKPLSK